MDRPPQRTPLLRRLPTFHGTAHPCAETPAHFAVSTPARSSFPLALAATKRRKPTTTRKTIDGCHLPIVLHPLSPRLLPLPCASLRSERSSRSTLCFHRNSSFLTGTCRFLPLSYLEKLRTAPNSFLRLLCLVRALPRPPKLLKAADDYKNDTLRPFAIPFSLPATGVWLSSTHFYSICENN